MVRSLQWKLSADFRSFSAEIGEATAPLLRQPNEIEGSDRIVIIFDKQHRGFHGIRKKARLPHPLRGGTRSHTRERRKIKAVQNNNPNYVVLPVTSPAHIVV